MVKTLTFAKREYKAAVKTKGFIIGLILFPLLMSGGFIGIAVFERRVDTADKHIAVIDHSGVVAEAIVQAAEARNAGEIFDKETGKQVKPAYRIEIVDHRRSEHDALRLELSDRVRSGRLRAFVEIDSLVLHQPGDAAARVSYHAENAALDDIRTWISWPINNRLRQLRLAEAGVDTSRVKDVFAWVGVDPLGLVSLDPETGQIRQAQKSSEAKAVGLPIAILFLMFMMTMMGAIPLLHAVMEEKMQRITEVLLGSITPFQFMMGKVLGGLGVSLTASSIYVVGGVFSLKRMGLTGVIPYDVLPWFFGYMVLNITMLGAVFASLGSTCSDAKDAQSMTMPAMMPVILPMFMLTPIVREPMSGFATYLSLFPPFTPMLMLMRMCTPGGVPAWQPWAGLVGVLVFALLAIWIGGRIIRIGILMQGKPPRLPDLLRWALRG